MLPPLAIPRDFSGRPFKLRSLLTAMSESQCAASMPGPDSGAFRHSLHKEF
jgi:hypothetical protein